MRVIDLHIAYLQNRTLGLKLLHLALRSGEKKRSRIKSVEHHVVSFATKVSR